MPRLVVIGPDGANEGELEIGDGEVVLIGRAPRADALQPLALPDWQRTRCVPIASPSISANHAVVWRVGERLLVRDLGSRNGSTVVLPRARTITIAGDDEVQLQLASRPDRPAADDEPPVPTWATPRDFAPAIGSAVQLWLARHGFEAEVRIVAAARDYADAPGRMPLANGDALNVVPLHTVDAVWSERLQRLWRWIALRNREYEAEQETRREGMILASPLIRVAHREVVEAARAGTPTLLLTGPSGAGKERLAEAFHRQTGRSGPFVALNCAMFSKDMLRSELFGAEAGSFTGATRRIIGAAERAAGGTLFLDEIGELSEEVQPMLLRFLDRREFERLGLYGRVQRADVCVVAATNRDLRELVHHGRFRADLWYRLSISVVEVPPLRARWEDVLEHLRSVLLPAGHSLADALAPEALELLRNHSWEGNFRELTNLTQRLPREAGRGSISEQLCRRALAKGSLTRGEPPAPALEATVAKGNWAELAARATAAFREDRGHDPATWDDQKECNEKYLKPLLFAHLSGVGQQPPPIDADALGSLATRVAPRVGADRGTALKQLTRYFERFGPLATKARASDGA